MADQSVIIWCRIDGYQDTLYAHSISSIVDFIFGNAMVAFQNCTVVAWRPLSNQKNTITAQGRIDPNPNQNTGTSIYNCKVMAGSDLVPVIGSIPTYLSRSWKEYSKIVFMQSYIGSHIDPKGWLEWNREFALKTLYYEEYLNSDPGAGTAEQVTWPGYHVITDAKEAMAFTVAALMRWKV